MLDNAVNPAHTSPAKPGEPIMLYRVHKTRRRDCRRNPWVLWWYEPPDQHDTYKARSIGPMTERMAEDHRALWQAELNGLLDESPERAVLWRDFTGRYLASARADLAPASLAVARQVLARFGRIVAPRLLERIDRTAIERYRIQRLRAVGPATVRKDMATLRAAWSWAVEMGLVAINPFDRIAFRGREQRPDPDALSPEQLDLFLAVLKDEPTWIQASLRLAVLWGPRAGELAGIRREDVDFSAGIVRIPVGGGRRTKEGRGKVVPADPDTLGLLQELSHRDGPLLWGPFSAPLGSARGKGGYTRTLGARARAILAGMGVRPRDDKPLQFLRRSAETYLRRRGVPDWQIGIVLGHGTRVGLANYSGMSREEIARQVAQVARLRVPPGSRPAGDDNQADPDTDSQPPENA